MNITLSTTASDHIDIAAIENILLQGTKDMTIGLFARLSRNTEGRLGVRIAPRSLLASIRFQIRVKQIQAYDSWDTNRAHPRNTNLRFRITIASVKQGMSTHNRVEALILQHEIAGLTFAEPSPSNQSVSPEPGHFIDETVDIPAVDISDMLFVRIQAMYNSSWSTGVLVGGNTNISEVAIYSLTFEDMPIGCESVQVQSLDGRLVSTTGNRIITYPILFLGRDPVREDAQGEKEVLIFRDQATTLRVTPQPIVLNEENDYSRNAVAESNGHWMLYEYDTVKLICTLGSGLPITAGAGNDIILVRKSSAFGTHGLYALTLLFATDTSDEPYIVPVILDYAVPLSVNGQTRILNLHLNEFDRCADLEIVRDRFWRIVGFPSDDLMIGVMEGIRNTRTTLCLRSDYSKLGVNNFTFIVQSGIRRVIVNVEVTVDKFFATNKNYVLLTPSNEYKQYIYVKRYNYGSQAADDYGYTFSTPANHTVSRKILGLVPPLGIADGSEPPGTIYDEVTIEYTGNRTVPQAGQYGSGDRVTLMTDADRTTANITCFRNIERNFDISGTDNRPTGNNAAWSFTKTIFQNTHTTTGNAWKYITPRNPPNEIAAISVRANQGLTSSGGGDVRTTDALDYNALRNGREVRFQSSSLRLNASHTVTLTISEYWRYVHNTTNTNVTSERVVSQSFQIQFETRYPHFFRVSGPVYLQWDNNWTQHHWLLTNPDAVISITQHTGGSALACTPPSNYTAGDFLMRLARQHAVNPTLDIYTVDVRSTIPNSLADDTFLDSPNRIINASFKTAVYHPKLIRNEIIPQMAASNREINLADSEVSSNFLITGTMTNSDFMLFDRNNVAERLSVFTASKNRLLGNNYDSRQNTASFEVKFDQPRVVRSWSYSVLGDRSIACGFLVEGWLDGIDEWETISAVTNFSTLAFSSDTNNVIIDYITAAPRPWSKLRITITQVRNANGSFVGTSASNNINGNFRVGQFQFYEGYPVLKRTTYIQRGNNDGQQLNTHGGTINYTARHGTNDPHVVVSVSDGKLMQSVNLSGSGIYAIRDGIDQVAYNREEQYWHYQLIHSLGAGQTTFSEYLACLGLRLAASVDIVGVRYDTSIVAGYSTAGAVAFDTSGQAVAPGSLTVPGSYSPLTLVSAWRYLGQCSLADFQSLNLNAPAQQKLTEFAKHAQEVIYGMPSSAPVVDGSIILQVNTVGRDFRLMQYVGGVWTNIGQDIITDFTDITGANNATSASLLASNGAILRAIAQKWWGSSAPLPSKIAFTNPRDKNRLLYTQSAPDSPTGTWDNIGEYSFDQYRGRQYYRSETRQSVLSVRAYIPGLADTSDTRSEIAGGGMNWIRSIMGEIQLFEQFPGVNVAYKDIKVNGTSVKYDGAAIRTTSSSINIACEGLTLNGEAAPGNRLCALVRRSSHLSWTTISQTGSNSSFSLESDHTITSVTLFYRMSVGSSTSSSDRMFPFFTFTVIRQ